MGEHVKLDRRARWQVGLIAFLVLAYGGLGFYLHAAMRTGIIYTHFGYIPIVLAGVWWGRRGIAVAVILGAIVLSFHALGVAAGFLWNDVARVVFFILVSACIGMLSEGLRTAHLSLAESEAMHRWLVEESYAGILFYRDERILFANKRFGEMLGSDAGSLVGKPIWTLFPEDEQPRVRAQVTRRENEGLADLHYECRMLRADGAIVWTDVVSSGATFQGGPCVVVNVFDITERKRAEQKQKELADLARRQEEQLVHAARLAELGEMAAAVAHELNQPLTGIRNFSTNAIYMLDNNAGDAAKVRENLRRISEQVDRASRILRQMRDMTQRSDRQRRAVDINRTVSEIAEFLAPQMKLTGVAVSFELDEGLPEVLGDRVRLEQVFLNLLTNARQAMVDAPVRCLHVGTRLEVERDCPVTVEIRDTGRGFAQEDADRLFAPFYTTKMGGHGTGLGLAISARIVKEHGGVIEAVGVPEKGAVFTVRLPRQEAASVQ